VGAAIHCRPCMAGRLCGRRAVLAETPAPPSPRYSLGKVTIKAPIAAGSPLPQGLLSPGGISHGAPLPRSQPRPSHCFNSALAGALTRGAMAIFA
jgi:hypothetical protein